MSEKPTQLTSVKVPTELFEDFRILSIRTKVNFQKLVERTLHLYTTDDQYRKIINNHIDTFYTGSKN